MSKHIPVLMSCDVYDILFTIFSDGQSIIEHQRKDLPSENLIFKGVVGEMNGKKYWVFRDNNEILWFMGTDIMPIEITDEITVSLKGKDPSTLIISRGDEVLLSIIYQREIDPVPAYYDFTAASMDEERGDFGLYIFNLLKDRENTRVVWGKDWQRILSKTMLDL